MKIKHYISIIILSLSLFACTARPEHITAVEEEVPMYPDYTNVTIPYNIAPLNFRLTNGATAFQVSVCGKKETLVETGTSNVCFSLKKWKKLLQIEKGETLTISVTALVNGRWLRYLPFIWQVAPEAIDGYLSYRLIEPGYEVWNALQLCERNLENFDEKVIADNNPTGGNCMNCHTYAQQSGKRSLFHLRGKNGGTILSRDGKLRKLALKNDSMISPAVYGDFHPSGRYGVFSSNIIIPAFHAQANRRLEVYDTKSDLSIADFDRNRMITSPLVSDKEILETFPTFSADGKWVYYCAAPVVTLPDSIRQLRYSLCRISFCAETGTWGNKIDTVWNARKSLGSVCFPKVSPDGNYLLFTVASYGTFPIWHQEADLRLLHLQTGEIDSLPTVNADRSDTYHSWASNSRWFVFASKRGDGQYGKPYFSYIDKQGKAHELFVLPQKDPAHYDHTFKSYNIPELSATPVPFDATDIKHLYEAIQVETFK